MAKFNTAVHSMVCPEKGGWEFQNAKLNTVESLINEAVIFRQI